MEKPPLRPQELRKRVLQNRLGGGALPADLGGPATLDSGKTSIGNDFSPISWEGYFDECKSVAIPEVKGEFRVYSAGTEGPLYFCLHGGGHSSLTFCLLAKHVKSAGGRVLALDLRGHGHTHVEDDGDLSTGRLCKDIVAVYEAVYAATPPPTILVGHSLGGALAVRVAAASSLPSVQGLVVLDVVEGTAMASLAHMQTFLSTRPSRFQTVERAIEWSLRSTTVNNPESARLSMPDQVTETTDSSGRSFCMWRTDLEKSEKYWEGWFKGLSEAFLSVAVPKILMLAGTDRLDKPLMIGQMQGKFQLSILYHAKHQLHEDQAGKVADLLNTFVRRYGIGYAMPKPPHWS